MTIARRPLAVALWLVAAVTTPGTAQSPTRVEGVVLRSQGGDRVPVPNVRVVLHRVGSATQGPIDTVMTTRSGRFRFRFVADTTANFLVSARHAGIEYFSNPVAINPPRPDTALELLVYDTASTARVTARARTLVVGAPDVIGARTVIDWFLLENDDTRTRVGADSSSPTWSAALPLGARNAQLGDPRLTPFSPEAVEFRGDSVSLTAPISPGQKELLLQYELPPDRFRLEVSVHGADSVDLFLEEAGIAPPAGWRVSDGQMIEGRRFQRLTRVDRFQSVLVVRFPGLGLKPERVLVWLVGGFGMALAVAGWMLLRRRRLLPATLSEPSASAFADQIARLDGDFAARGPTGPEERDAFVRQRAELVARLEAALARRPRVS